jgi:hypothetical protein
MTDSKRIAGLLGPVLIVLSASEAVNPHIWEAVTAPATYQAGALWFVSGLAVVRDHNRWTKNWPVLVTLVGWFAILGGLFRMFAPRLSQQQVQSISSVFVGQMILLAIGNVLTFKAYSPAPSKSGARR